MQSDAKSVPAYLKELADDDIRKALTKLRALIRRSVPDAAESMQHGMPAYDLNGLLCTLPHRKTTLPFTSAMLHWWNSSNPKLAK